MLLRRLLSLIDGWSTCSPMFSHRGVESAADLNLPPTLDRFRLETAGFRRRSMMRIMASLTKAATVRISFKIACQAAIAADPGQGSFDDPAVGQYDRFPSSLRLTI